MQRKYGTMNFGVIYTIVPLCKTLPNILVWSQFTLGCALQKNNISQVKITHPFPWSEDFGHYKKVAPSLFFGLGSGLNQYALHHRNYDFPDSIIRVGAEFFCQFIMYLVSNSV
jgi:metal-dependent amidase/aminoacylase/carboxypeptidase family protein